MVLLIYLKYWQSPWTAEFISVLKLSRHVSHLTHLILCNRIMNAHPCLCSASAQWIELKSLLDRPGVVIHADDCTIKNCSFSKALNRGNQTPPTGVFSAKGARLVGLCLTLPGLHCVPQNNGLDLLEASLLPCLRRGLGDRLTLLSAWQLHVGWASSLIPTWATPQVY